MAGFTNRGKKCIGNAYFCADATDLSNVVTMTTIDGVRPSPVSTL